ncbi:MAG: HD domain-containing protein [Acidobacteria bacterium]|nr:HD domain-containing protein [Acidobacteriota bacterium]
MNQFRKVAQGAALAQKLPVAVLATNDRVEASNLRSVLEKYKFRVMDARDGVVALDLALKYSAQLVIAAINLPLTDAYQLCQQLREERNTEVIPFMFISPPGEIPDNAQRHETFASDYVQRPVDLNEFERRLKGILQLLKTEEPGRLSAKMAPKRPALEPLSPPSQVRNVVTTFRNSQTWLPSAVQDLEETANKAGDEGAGELPKVEDKGRDEAEELTKPQAPVEGTEIERRVVFGRAESAERDVVRKNVAETFPAAEAPSAESVGAGDLSQQEIGETAATVYKEATLFFLASIHRAEVDALVDPQKGLEIAGRVVGLLKQDNGLLLLATDHTVEFSLARHSVNVAIIASRIGQTLDMPETQITQLCLAGILHDIGTAKIPRKVIYMASALTPKEQGEIRQRPVYSAQILSNIPGFEWLSRIVSQVYERENGTGFPYGLKGKDICIEAKVLGIADVFEACTHARPNRNEITGYQTMKELTGHGGEFSDRLVKALIRSFSVYPFNECVVLSTGEVGKVIDVNTENSMRPTVKILSSAEGEPLYEPKIVNLARHASVHITRAITGRELPARSISSQSVDKNRKSS